MRSIWLKSLLWTLGLIGFSAVGARTFGPSIHGSLALSFWDAETGYAVTPRSVSIRNLESGQAEFDGVLPSGDYLVEVQAFGYETMAAQTEVVTAKQSRLSFHLDPVKPSAKLRNLSKLHRANSMLIAGFVTDESGQPVHGANVEGVESANDGFFAVRLPAGERYVYATISKEGFVSQTRAWIEAWPNGDAIFRVRLKKGNGSQIVDERLLRRREGEETEDAAGCDVGCSDDSTQTESGGTTDGVNAPVLPKNIRVGRNCPTATTCSTVEVYSVDTYAKHVLSAEWYSCWGSLNGGMNSLKAGAVAVRSYGVYHVYNPRTSTYDICDTTSCQVFGASTSTNAINAVDQTTRYVLTQNGAITRSEYSSENNNAGCGDGFSGTGTSSAPCISDQPCAGFSTFGHGRGLCQFGSARWAAGTRITTGSPCSNGVSHGLGQQTWQWILGHYYPNYILQQGAALSLTGLSSTPGTTGAGTTVTLNYDVAATSAVDGVFLGASIRLNGSSTLVSDPPHDLLTNFVFGGNSRTRPFDVAAGQALGSYDLLGGLYFDRNNSGTLNAGDFLMADLTVLNALTVQSTNITVSVSPSRAKVLPGRTKQFNATVQGSSNQSVTWSIVSGSGTVSATGLFTAANNPAAGPTKTVVKATSVANPARSATATVFTLGY